MAKKKQDLVVAVSGGFDPIHIGHVRLFNEAKKLGGKLVVILNNDNWLKKKKGFVFLTAKERKEIIENLRSVDEVVITSHPENPIDMGVTGSLKKIKPDIFANGGDRKPNQLPLPGSEIEWAKQNNCKMVYNLGRGGKIQSSSVMAMKLIEDILQKKTCPCGSKKHFTKCMLKQTPEHKENLKKILNKV